jgi:hypothetical protein
MRSRVVRALKPLDAMAVENGAQPGTPDVECILGWIELKSLDHWPKVGDRPVRCDHFRQLQRLWLTRRSRKGGPCWLLLRVKNEWLLLAGDVAASILGTSNKSTLVTAALKHWASTPTDSDLLATIHAAGLQRLRQLSSVVVAERSMVPSGDPSRSAEGQEALPQEPGLLAN